MSHQVRRTKMCPLYVVLPSQGRHNEVLQTGWLKTAEMYCLTVLESGVWDQGVRGHALSESPRGASFLTSSSLWQPRFPWSVATLLQSLLLSSHCVSVFSPSPKDTRYTGLRGPPYSNMTSSFIFFRQICFASYSKINTYFLLNI